MVLFFTLVFLILLGSFILFGGFKKINFQTRNAGGESLIFENVRGSYHNAYKLYEKVYKELLDDYKIEATRAFGIYYDDPKKTAQISLYSIIGCIVENIDKKTLEKVTKTLEYKVLPEGEYLVTEFPFRGSFSIIIGMTKVHPLVRKFLKENSYETAEIVEIYDYPNNKIIYMTPLRKRE